MQALAHRAVEGRPSSVPLGPGHPLSPLPEAFWNPWLDAPTVPPWMSSPSEVPLPCPGRQGWTECTVMSTLTIPHPRTPPALEFLGAGMASDGGARF